MSGLANKFFVKIENTEMEAKPEPWIHLLEPESGQMEHLRKTVSAYANAKFANLLHHTVCGKLLLSFLYRKWNLFTETSSIDEHRLMCYLRGGVIRCYETVGLPRDAEDSRCYKISQVGGQKSLNLFYCID